MRFTRALTAIVFALAATGAWAGVSSQEAQALKGDLTPFGAERAGNKDGTIPAWTGGYTTPIPGEKPGRRGDPFKNEKPLYSVTSKNAAQYADKLTDGVKAMLSKYPDTYRVDVYPTHRTAAAPQWVYDNTFKNATRARLEGEVPMGAYGGIPFPIPKSGMEVMWNHLLAWRAPSYRWDANMYQMTADGRLILTTDGQAMQQHPYYFEDGTPGTFNGDYFLIKLLNVGPPIRSGEAILGRTTLDPDKTQGWLYLTGQRRVRKLPNTCCDTPTPAAAGVMSFDEIETFQGRLSRFDWKILGKKEMLIPYNSNRLLQPTKDREVLMPHHLNPDHVRWELHRVWVVEATVRAGQRHQAARSLYYCDEDTWRCGLADRWDANGQLWKTIWTIPYVMPDIPATYGNTTGFYDLLSGTGFAAVLYNEKRTQYAPVPRFQDKEFTPEALSGESVR